VINQRHDPRALSLRYAAGTPFPHIVLDEFLDPRVAEQIATELESTDVDTWNRDDHDEQVNKRWMPDPGALPTVTGSALRYLNTPAACAFFSVLTGIGDLQSDPAYVGGGAHVTLTGGRLGVHADFNLHPDTGLHRRVNALLFLNRGWDPAWHGQLELWGRDLEHPVASIDPVLNRLVVFTITDDAFHGVPTPVACPPERKRFSLALYYYTADRPEEEKAPFHWAAWQEVPS
jgi:hypothetical protein